MPGNETLNIILNIGKKGTGGEDTKKKLTGVEKAAQSAGKALLAFVSVESIKATFELAQLGAQSLRTKAAFEAISGGADAASANLEAMKVATRGALSEQQAMASANQLMQMGLANNSEELGNMAEMATRLGSAMGKDAAASLEEFALLLANQSIPRLDTFGISAGKVRLRINELTSSVEGMTREQAFMQAVTEEGQASMERLGPAVDDAALAFERGEATIADFTAELGERLAPAISEAVEAGVLLLTWSEQVDEALQLQSETLITTASSYEEYVVGTLGALVAANRFDEGLARNAQQGLLNAETNLELANTLGVLSQAEFEVAQAVDAVSRTTDTATVGMANAADVMRGSTDAALAAAAASGEFAAAQALAAQDSADLATSLKDATSGQIASRLIGMLDPEKMGADAYGAAVADIGLSFGLMDEKSIALAENMDALAESIESGVIPAEDADEALRALIEDAEDGQIGINKMAGEFDILADSTLAVGSGLRDASGGMAGISANAPDAAIGIDDVGGSAGLAAGDVGSLAGELGTTEEKLAALVAGSPWRVSVIATSGGPIPDVNPGISLPGGGRVASTDNRQFNPVTTINNFITDPMAAAAVIEDQRRLLDTRLERGF